MSSAANAPLYNIRERKQCNLLNYVSAPRQLFGTHKHGNVSAAQFVQGSQVKFKCASRPSSQQPFHWRNWRG